MLKLYWAAYRKKEEDKLRAKGMLVAFLSKLCESDQWRINHILPSLHTFAIDCDAAPVTWGRCRHITEVQRLLERPRMHGTWGDLAVSLTDLAVLAHDCRDCARVLGFWLAMFTTGIDRRVDRMGFEQDPSKAALPQGRQKRLRVDEDLKRYMTVDAVSAGRFHSAAQGLRMIGFGHHASNSGAQWEEQGLQLYLTASWQGFEGGGVTCVANDGKRLGNPAEETEVFLCWHGKSNVSTVTPPMVGLLMLQSVPPPMRAARRVPSDFYLRMVTRYYFML